MYKFSIIILFIVVLIITFIYMKITNNELSYIESQFDSEKYLVRNDHDKIKAANLLATMKKICYALTTYLYTNIYRYENFKKYIAILHTRMTNTIFCENISEWEYTSYTLNKGEKMVLCLRDMDTNKLIDVNTLTYVVIHEMAHVACPELNHTKLFKEIFKFFLYIAINQKIYAYVNYKNNPVRYCGMTINESLVM